MTYTFYEKLLEKPIVAVYMNGVLLQEGDDYVIDKIHRIITIKSYYFNDLIVIRAMDYQYNIAGIARMYRA